MVHNDLFNFVATTYYHNNYVVCKCIYILQVAQLLFSLNLHDKQAEICYAHALLWSKIK